MSNPLDEEDIKVILEQLKTVGQIENEGALHCCMDHILDMNRGHDLSMYEELVLAQMQIITITNYIAEAAGMEKVEEAVMISAQQAMGMIVDGEDKTVH